MASTKKNAAGGLLVGLLALFLSDCAIHRTPAELDTPPCRSTGISEPAIRWVLRTSAEERAALDAWCWSVGAPVLARRTAPATAPLDSLAVIVWNSYVGDGDLSALITDLRSGRLTGAPVEQFVVLLQEAHRAGTTVPGWTPGWASSAHRFGNWKNSQRLDITQSAEALGLSLLYAPSMRNGSANDGKTAEDRGNAILSTLPLNSPALVELPWERQRRIAVVAEVQGQTAGGNPWTLRLVSAHFDNRTRLARLHRSLGAGRTNQARALAEQLADGAPTILGADLNTWLGGAGAAAAQVLRQQLPLPVALPGTKTLPLPGPLPDMQLDYLLFRLPQDWQGQYRVLDHKYGSDHRPLLGWVHVGSAADAPGSSATAAR